MTWNIQAAVCIYTFCKHTWEGIRTTILKTQLILFLYGYFDHHKVCLLCKWLIFLTSILLYHTNISIRIIPYTCHYEIGWILQSHACQNIVKYHQMKKKNPKKINRIAFKHSKFSPLDSIMDRQNNILTNLEDIAKELRIQQSINNRPTAYTCHYRYKHPPHCTCGVRQYPWHNLNWLTIDQHEEPQTPLHTYFDQETYDFCLKDLETTKPQDQTKFHSQLWKICHLPFTNYCFYFLNIVTNKNKSMDRGKPV